MRYGLVGCFFVSGATSLVLEVAWAKELSYHLGNSLYAVSTVIAAFMAGLALGSYVASRSLGRVRAPIRVYGLLQLAIALCGAASIPVLRSTAPLFGWLHAGLGDLPGVFFVSRFAVVFALILVPVTLMGMTLPLVIGVYGRRKERYDFETGLLYGVNTLGAVMGTLLAGFALLPEFGLMATCVAVGAVDALVGLAALLLQRALGPVRPAGAPAARMAPASSGGLRGTRRSELLGLLYFASGLIAIALEVLWFRYLVYVFGPTADAFSVMLAVYLSGVALGSAVGARVAREARSALAAFTRLQCGLAAVVLLSLLLFDVLPEWYARLYWTLAPDIVSPSAALAQTGIASLVVLPGTLAMGALFPVSVRAYVELVRTPDQPEYTVGRLYALNTLGGICGSFLAGFWLLPTFGIWNTALVASGASLALGAAAAYLAPAEPPHRRWAFPASAGVGLLVLALLLPRPDLLALNRGMYMLLFNRDGQDRDQLARYDQGRRVLFYREGINASVAVTAEATGSLALRLSGKPVADTSLVGRAHLVFLGQLPALFAARPQRAAVIGLGTGITTASVLSHGSVASVDVIELEQGVVAASQYFAHTTDHALADPRTRIVIDDGRTFLGHGGGGYDILTTDPISPVVAGAANLYTRDFYEIARQSLSEDGIFCQWLETWIPSESTYRGILASLRAAFPHVVLFSVQNTTVVMASAKPIRRPWDALEARFREPDVQRRFEALGIDSAAQLLTFFLAGNEQVDRYVEDAPRLNTDDDNWLERQMPADLRRTDRPSLDAILLRRFAGRRVDALRDLVPGVPLNDVAELVSSPGRRVVGGPPESWIPEFLGFFQREGAGEQLQQMQESTSRTSGQTFLSDKEYARLVSASRHARSQKRWPAAQEALQEIFEYPYRPHYYEAGVALAQLHAREGRYPEALRYTRLLRATAPAYPAAFVVEIQILEAMDRPAQARAVADQARLFGLEHPGLERFPTD